MRSYPERSQTIIRIEHHTREYFLRDVHYYCPVTGPSLRILFSPANGACHTVKKVLLFLRAY